jgi:hypothetical protein
MDSEPRLDEGADERAQRRRVPGSGAFGIVQAIGLGLKDTASDMLRAGREGAAQAYDEMWERYEGKTKRRRRHKERNE